MLDNPDGQVPQYPAVTAEIVSQWRQWGIIVDARGPQNSIGQEVAAIALELDRSQRTALTRLYDVVAPRLVRYAETLTRNLADAEDALQTTLVRVTKAPWQLAGAQNPWAYLVRMVRNESLRILERRKSARSLATMLRSDSPSACELEASESRQLVQQAVKRLPSEQAEVVVLKIWEDFTFAEIAELTGESPNTAASRYRYAMEKLSRFLQPLAEVDRTAPRPIGPIEESATRTVSGEVDHA